MSYVLLQLTTLAHTSIWSCPWLWRSLPRDQSYRRSKTRKDDWRIRVDPSRNSCRVECCLCLSECCVFVCVSDFCVNVIRFGRFLSSRRFANYSQRWNRSHRCRIFQHQIVTVFISVKYRGSCSRWGESSNPSFGSSYRSTTASRSNTRAEATESHTHLLLFSFYCHSGNRKGWTNHLQFLANTYKNNLSREEEHTTKNNTGYPNYFFNPACKS